jgi:hypothetical protein
MMRGAPSSSGEQEPDIPFTRADLGMLLRTLASLYNTQERAEERAALRGGAGRPGRATADEPGQHAVVFRDITGPDLDGVLFDLLFYQIIDVTADRGTPVLENLRPSHGFVRVRITRDGELIYQHPHPVRELIGEPLRAVLRRRGPAVTHWGYGVRGPGLESIALTRPAPAVAHETRVRSGPWPRLRLTVEEMPDPEPPETTLAALGIPGTLSADDADDAERPGGYLIQLTAALSAERTGASLLNFTFTGESFLRVSQQLESRGGKEQLLGWYHTHLFAATSRPGLSSVDVELHRSTFRRPWQVAALVNIGHRGRVLRFYHGEGEEMTLVPYWTVPHQATAPETRPDAEPDPARETSAEAAGTETS